MVPSPVALPVACRRLLRLEQPPLPPRLPMISVLCHVPMMYRTCPGTLITTRTEYVRTDGNATSTPHTHHSKRHLDRRRFASLSGRTVSHSRRPRGRSGGCRTYRDHCPATPEIGRASCRERM